MKRKYSILLGLFSLIIFFIFTGTFIQRPVQADTTTSAFIQTSSSSFTNYDFACHPNPTPTYTPTPTSTPTPTPTNTPTPTPTTSVTPTPTSTPTWANTSERQRTGKEMMTQISNADGHPRARTNDRTFVNRGLPDGIGPPTPVPRHERNGLTAYTARPLAWFGAA